MDLPNTANIRFRRYYQNLQPIIKRPRFRASTTAVFSFLAISLFLWYAVRPTAQTIIYLQREIADKTQVSQQMEAKITALIDAQATYENISDRLPILDQALPHRPDGAILARELKNIADASQASVSAIQIPSIPLTTDSATPGAKLTAQKPLQEFPITMVLTGAYPALKAFLNGLVSLRRIVTIEQIVIRQNGDFNNPTSELQLSVHLKSYYSLQ